MLAHLQFSPRELLCEVVALCTLCPPWEKLRASSPVAEVRRKCVQRALTVVALALLCALRPAAAQPPGTIPRIGVLASHNVVFWDAFRHGLRELGYIEGQTVVLEYRWAEGDEARFPHLAADLVRVKADVIVTWGTPATLAAKNATTTIPIVMASSGNPLGTGLIASLARPGGNITGVAPHLTVVR